MKRLGLLLLFCASALAQTTTIPITVTQSASGTTFSMPTTTVPPYVPVCTIAQPAPTTATIACPSGSTGSWTQTTPFVSAAYPACWVPGTPTPSGPPAGACVANTLPDAVVTTGGVNILASTKVNWDYGNITQIGPVTYAGANAWQLNACTATATPTTQVCSHVPAGGGGGWLNPFPSPGYFNSAGYNWVQITVAPTRAGQVWLLGQPYVPNTATTTDVPVAGSVAIQDISKYGPKPQVGVYGVYKIPLHCGVVANDCGVNAHVAGDILLKQGIQDQINSSGNNPTLGAGNIWYLSDFRYTAK